MTAATASAAPNRTARPARPRPPLGAWSLIAIAVVVTIVAGSAIDFTILPLFTDTGRGWFIISQFFAPDWSFLVQTIHDRRRLLTVVNERRRTETIAIVDGRRQLSTIFDERR